jgi:integrase
MRKWVAQGGERFTFHDSRAKATTDVIEQGRKASELTGHKLESTVTTIYDRRHIRKSAPVR